MNIVTLLPYYSKGRWLLAYDFFMLCVPFCPDVSCLVLRCFHTTHQMSNLKFKKVYAYTSQALFRKRKYTSLRQVCGKMQGNLCLINSPLKYILAPSNVETLR